MGGKSRPKKIIIHRSRCRLRALRNWRVRNPVPYNLHTLQLEGMQEKTLVLAVNL